MNIDPEYYNERHDTISSPFASIYVLPLKKKSKRIFFSRTLINLQLLTKRFDCPTHLKIFTWSFVGKVLNEKCYFPEFIFRWIVQGSNK